MGRIQHPLDGDAQFAAAGEHQLKGGVQFDRVGSTRSRAGPATCINQCFGA